MEKLLAPVGPVGDRGARESGSSRCVRTHFVARTLRTRVRTGVANASRIFCIFRGRLGRRSSGTRPNDAAAEPTRDPEIGTRDLARVDPTN